jgi:hypothetical protein
LVDEMVDKPSFRGDVTGPRMWLHRSPTTPRERGDRSPQRITGAVARSIRRALGSFTSTWDGRLGRHMDSRTREHAASDDAVEFVRFCYSRRRVGWPELYDEMCAVAGRGLFRGWGSDELSAEGIGFSLFEMPALASLVHRVVADEQERRARLAAPAVVRAAPPAMAVDDDLGAAPAVPLRLAAAGAGA